MPAEVTATKEKHRHHHHSHHTASPLQQAQPSPASDPAPAGDAATASDPAPAETAAPAAAAAAPVVESKEERKKRRAEKKKEKEEAQKAAEDARKAEELAAREERRATAKTGRKNSQTTAANKKESAQEQEKAAHKQSDAAELARENTKTTASSAPGEAARIQREHTASRLREHQAEEALHPGRQVPMKPETYASIQTLKKDQAAAVRAKMTGARNYAEAARAARNLSRQAAEAAATAATDAATAATAAETNAKDELENAAEGTTHSTKRQRNGVAGAKKNAEDANTAAKAAEEWVKKAETASSDAAAVVNVSGPEDKLTAGVKAENEATKISSEHNMAASRLPPLVKPFKRRRNGALQSLVESLTPGNNTPVGASHEPKAAFAEADYAPSKADKADSIFGGIMEGVGVLAGAPDIADNVAGMEKIASLAELRNINSISDSAKGLPIAGAIFNTISSISDFAHVVADIVTMVKEGKHHTAEEVVEIIHSHLELLSGISGTIQSYLSIFKKFTDAIPLVGVIIAAVATGLGLISDIRQLVKASVGIHRMKQQKETAKAQIEEAQNAKGISSDPTNAGAFVVRRHSRANIFKIGKAGLHYRGNDMGMVEDRGSKSHGKQRKKRLDEKVKEMRKLDTATGLSLEERAVAAEAAADEAEQNNAPNASALRAAATAARAEVTAVPEKDGDLANALEEYDVTKELTGANKKRLRQALTNIVFEDAAGLLTAAAGLDPSGVGPLAGAAVNLLIGAGSAGKSAATAIRGVGRDHGWKHFNLNKSKHNKGEHRYSLALATYKKMASLPKYNFASIPAGGLPRTPEEIDQVEKGLPEYDTVARRIDAMGAGYGPLIRATTKQEMVDTMMQGFYRDA